LKSNSAPWSSDAQDARKVGAHKTSMLQDLVLALVIQRAEVAGLYEHNICLTEIKTHSFA
jgi:hypothetical protein